MHNVYTYICVCMYVYIYIYVILYMYIIHKYIHTYDPQMPLRRQPKSSLTLFCDGNKTQK